MPELHRMIERLNNPGGFRDVRKPSGRFAPKKEMNDRLFAGLLSSSMDSSKTAEILSKGNKRVFQTPDATTPSEGEVSKKFGRTPTHPAPRQNTNIKNFPVTARNTTYKAASAAAGKIAVMMTEVAGDTVPSI